MFTSTTTPTSRSSPEATNVTTEMFVIQFNTNTPGTPKWNIRRSTGTSALSVNGIGWPKGRDWRRIRREVRKLLESKESVEYAVVSLQRVFEKTKWFNESYEYGR